MAEWKKVIVSGSTANLANVQVDSLSSGVVTGASGNLTTTAINGTGNIVATTNASGLIHSGSFSGSFVGDGSSLTGITATTLDIDNFGSDHTANTVAKTDKLAISDGGTEGRINVQQLANPLAGDGLQVANDAIAVDASAIAGTGLEDDGSENLRLATQGNGIAGGNGSTLSVNASGSSLTVNSDGVGIAAGGVVTSHIANDAVTADKLADTAVTAGSYGSSTAIPTFTVDAQGRLTAAGTANVSSTLAISGSTGNDEVSLVNDALSFAGNHAISVAVTDNTVTINGSDGLVSGSSIASSAQGQVALTTNGVAASAVDLGLQTSDDVTFNTATLSAGATVTAGGLTVTAGGATITDGGLDVNGGAVTLGTAGTTVEGGGLTVTAGGATVTAGGLTVSAGGADVTGNSTFANDVTVTGDLIVNGDTVSLNTTNLNIEDQFILLDSGSAGNTDNGIVFASGSANAGDSLFYDAGKDRLSFGQSVSWNATAVTPDAFIPYIVDTQESHDDSDTRLAKRGNIKVDANDVYIYI